MITCGIYLLDKNGLLLICKATGGGWGIPKGLQDEGESFWNTAKRELLEETSINLDLFEFDKPKKLPKIKYKKRNKYLISFVVRLNINHNELKLKCISSFTKDNKQYPEIEKFNWVTIEVAKNIIHESQIHNLSLL